MNTCRIAVFQNEAFACIRIIGRANLGCSIDFKTLVEELRRRGCPKLILELSECSLMDSTFLGVLTGLGLKLRQQANTRPLELLNPNPRILELLETLGVLQLFHTCEGEVPGMERADEAPAAGASREQLSRVCLEAHETLMKLSPENEARFKDVARFLAEDIRTG